MKFARPPFNNLVPHRYRAILADPSWSFKTWSDKGRDRSIDKHYTGMNTTEIERLPVVDLAAPDCALFMWATWPMLPQAMQVIVKWGFEYKTCAFTWVKLTQTSMPFTGLGYWTRANTEPCLLATRGKPKRVHRDVAQVVLEPDTVFAPRREHSRKPDCIYERIERLVDGPYLELFARTRQDGWTAWGNEVDKFKPVTSSLFD